MKIALLEPIGVPEETIQAYGDKIRSLGHEFVSYDTVTTDPEELKERSKGCEIVMIANHPYKDEVVAASEDLKMISVAFTGIDHVGISRQSAILAFQFGDGLSNVLWPTASAPIICGIAGIKIEKWWKWFVPLFLLILLTQAVLMAISTIVWPV